MHRKLSSILRIAVVATLALGFGRAYAFHSGGVAECSGCHSMHSPAPGGSFLLVGTDQSSTCLSCHGKGTALSGYHVATEMPTAASIPQQLTPGGDFSWLLKTFTYYGRASGGVYPVLTEAGQTHGHNVVAADYGFSVDTDFVTAPGGTFPSSQLGCQSCHDPHGKLRRMGGDTGYSWGTTGAPIVGSGSYNNSAVPTATKAVGHYRLLRGHGDAISGASFPGVVIASAPSSYNQSEGTTAGVGSQVRVAYAASGSDTMGQFCAACHPGMHSATGSTGTYVHPIDQALGQTIADNYNAYVTSGIMTGSAASSFSSLTPFAESTASFTVTKSHASNSNAYLNGPATADQVMCLSCHRAHASGFPDALRWYVENEFITRADSSGNPAYPGTDVPGFTTQSQSIYTVGRTSAEWQQGYYGRPAVAFGAVGFQRQLCNKCHAKD